MEMVVLFIGCFFVFLVFLFFFIILMAALARLVNLYSNKKETQHTSSTVNIVSTGKVTTIRQVKKNATVQPSVIKLDPVLVE